MNRGLSLDGECLASNRATGLFYHNLNKRDDKNFMGPDRVRNLKIMICEGRIRYVAFSI